MHVFTFRMLVVYLNFAIAIIKFY